MNTQDFIREFVHNDRSVYVDLGNYDCGVSEDNVYIRDKLANDVTQLRRTGIRVSATTRISPSYYIAAVGLLVMAFYFTVFFMRDALGGDVWIFAMLGLFIIPFIMRRFISGYRIIVFYFVLCIAFSLTVGSWEENELGSGVLIFYVIGIMPYVASRVFSKIWTETSLVLSSDHSVSLSCPDVKVRGLMRALGIKSTEAGSTINT